MITSLRVIMPKIKLIVKNGQQQYQIQKYKIKELKIMIILVIMIILR